MSLLNTNPFKKLTVKFLKEQHFEKIPWGSPDRYRVSHDRFRRGRALWDKEHYCYSLYIDNLYIDDLETSLTIYWFPKGFTGYVTPFRGAPKPGTLFVVPDFDGYAESTYENINTESDLIIALEHIKNTYKTSDYED